MIIPGIISILLIYGILFQAWRTEARRAEIEEAERLLVRAGLLRMDGTMKW